MRVIPVAGTPADSSWRCAPSPGSNRINWHLLGLALAVVLTGCATPARTDPVRQWEASVVKIYPHDRSAFTQGLEWHDGLLYETSGGYGKSWIGVSEPETGAVRLRLAAPDDHFAEGMTVVNGKIWQLTWRNNVAVLRDKATLAVLRDVRYEGEGWGLCHGSGRLVMSNGSPRLSFRDPSTFAEVGTVTVTLRGRPVDELNELECVGSSVWANIWRSEQIVRIDLETGRVTDQLQVGEMPGLTAEDRREGSLNGIAALPGTGDLLITGKNWPHLYRIALKPAG